MSLFRTSIESAIARLKPENPELFDAESLRNMSPESANIELANSLRAAFELGGRAVLRAQMEEKQATEGRE